jgi:DNA-binding winged helix-turn-helix (wHTH) protein/tetratricopeptide (TPR) repeat protein
VIYRFDAFELDDQAYTLQRQGRSVRLRRKLFDVLLYLMEHRERVVTNHELLEALWGNEHVAPSVVHWTISRLRRALGQSRGSQLPIETIPRRGYRFASALVTEAGSPQRRVSIAAPSSEAASLSAGSDSAFVGREAVLQMLSGAFASARESAGGLYLLIGEPGIGKSRCALELASRLGADASVWSATCAGNPSAPPLWPWLQILRACEEGEASGSSLQLEVRALREELQAGDVSDERSAVARAFGLLDRTRQLLLELSRSRPRLVIFDDVHDADASSLELLALLVPQLAKSSLMVLATLHAPSLDPQRAPDPRLLDIRSRAQSISLLPWSRNEVAQFVSGTVRSPAAAALAEVIWRRSGGNPLFAQQLLLLHVVRSGTDIEALPADGMLGSRMLPGDTQELLRRRLAGLPPETVAVLGAASVIGCSFELALLQRITGQPASELLAALDPALRVGMLEPGERSSEYAFRHELIRDAIYADLSGAERSRLHGKTGAALEDPAIGAASPSVLAWHFYCAAPLGHAARAVDHAMRAAREARRMDAHADEARYCEWALEAQAFDETLDATRRGELLIALGSARMELGENEAARRHISRAIEIAEARNLPAVLARAAFALRPSMLLAWLPDTLALRALEEARRDLPADAVALRGQVAAYLSCIHPYSDRPDQREALIQEALLLARASGNPRSLFDALRARCQSLTAPDRVDDLLRWSTETEDLAAQTGSRAMLLESQSYRYLGLLQRGDVSDANELLAELNRTTSKLGVGEADWLHRHLEARHEFYAGHLDRAAELYTDLRRRSRVAGTTMTEFHYTTGMSLVHSERGSLGAFWPEYQEIVRLWKGRSPSLCAQSALFLAAQGREREARAELERIPLERLSRRPMPGGYLGMLATTGRAASVTGDRVRCERVYEELLPFAQHNAVDIIWFCLGSVAHFLGLIARALEDRDAAIAHFELAIQRNSEFGYRPYAARSRFELARTLVESGEVRQRREASALLDEVEPEARKMGLTALLDSIGALRHSVSAELRAAAKARH